jgi:hypothetical protein
MATITPPNLYTAGNVVFNTQPSTNFAIQLLQQKKAKDEALEQYYQKLPQTINEAGMRDNERPKFMQKIGDLQTYWRDNRDAIKNARRDGGAAQYNYEKKFREIRELVDASKQLAKDDLELGKQWLDPNKRYIFRNNQIVDRISKHNIPYGDPGHERLDLYSLTQPPKPRTVADWQQLNKTLTDGLQLGETPTGKVEDLGNFKKRHYILKQHSGQNLKTIGEKALAMYGTDYDWQGEADAQYEEALKNPKALEPYNQVYQQVMKRPIKNAGDLFAAQRIVEQSKAVEDYKDEVDRKAEMDYRFGQQVALKRIPQATADKKEGSATGPIGNVLNTIQVGGGQQSGWYTMGAGGNKQNLASIQQLLGDNVMKLSSINGTAANDPKNRVEYLVENGEVKAIRYKGLVYDRDYFERAQKQLDKNPQWEGKLRYPEQQQTGAGHYSPNKGKNTSSKNNDPLGLGL